MQARRSGLYRERNQLGIPTLKTWAVERPPIIPKHGRKIIMAMNITFRDNGGYVTVEIDRQYGVSFCDGLAYFTDADGNDYEIPMAHLMAIE